MGVRRLKNGGILSNNPKINIYLTAHYLLQELVLWPGPPGTVTARRSLPVSWFEAFFNMLTCLFTFHTKSRVTLICIPQSRGVCMLLSWHLVYYSMISSFVGDIRIREPLFFLFSVWGSVHRMHQRPLLLVVFIRHRHRSFQTEDTLPMRRILRQSNQLIMDFLLWLAYILRSPVYVCMYVHTSVSM
jgi:hypothetical protein